MPPFRYHRPESLDEATALLAEHGGEAKVLAGGQSLLPLLAMRLAHPEHMVDITRLPDLASIEQRPDGSLLIGASVRHAAAEVSPVVAARSPMMAAAMPFIGHRAIRNRGTVCGSLAHADPAAELPAVALALDAELVVRSAAGERRVPAAGFFKGYLQSDLDDGDLLVGLSLPPWPDRAGWSVQETSRRHGDFAVIGVAAAVVAADDGTISRAVLSFFGADATPVRVAEAESALAGRRPGDDAWAEAARIVSERLTPPSDNHGSAAYRKHVAGVLARRALAEAAGRAGVAA